MLAQLPKYVAAVLAAFSLCIIWLINSYEDFLTLRRAKKQLVGLNIVKFHGHSQIYYDFLCIIKATTNQLG